MKKDMKIEKYLTAHDFFLESTEKRFLQYVLIVYCVNRTITFQVTAQRTEIVNIVENTYTRNTGVSSQVNTQVNTGKNLTINTH